MAVRLVPTSACRHLYRYYLFPTQLLDYVMTALLFSDKNVNSNLITWNRVVLLHGNARGLCVTSSLLIALSLCEELRALLWWEPQLSSSAPRPEASVAPISACFLPDPWFGRHLMTALWLFQHH